MVFGAVDGVGLVRLVGVSGRQQTQRVIAAGTKIRLCVADRWDPQATAAETKIVDNRDLTKFVGCDGSRWRGERLSVGPGLLWE